MQNEDFDIPGVEVALKWAGTRPAALEVLRRAPQKKPFILDAITDPTATQRWKMLKRLRLTIRTLPKLPLYRHLFLIDIDPAAHERWQKAMGIHGAVQRSDMVELERIITAIGDDRMNELWAEHVGDPNLDDPAREAAVDSARYFSKMWVRTMVDKAYSDTVRLRVAFGLEQRPSPVASTLTGFVRSPIPPSVRFAVLNRDNYTCRYCGRKAPEVALEMDHRVPVSHGGTNDIGNLVTSCAECNRGKSNRFQT